MHNHAKFMRARPGSRSPDTYTCMSIHMQSIHICVSLSISPPDSEHLPFRPRVGVRESGGAVYCAKRGHVLENEPGLADFMPRKI